MVASAKIHSMISECDSLLCNDNDNDDDHDRVVEKGKKNTYLREGGGKKKQKDCTLNVVPSCN